MEEQQAAEIELYDEEQEQIFSDLLRILSKNPRITVDDLYAQFHHEDYDLIHNFLKELELKDLVVSSISLTDSGKEFLKRKL